MTISGTTPERGVRVELELAETSARVRYVGSAYLPDVTVPLALEVDAASGAATVTLGEGAQALARADVSFVEQLGKQAHRLATQTPPEDGGGRWPRRIHRWRAPRGE